jgi:hypothetical protein
VLINSKLRVVVQLAVDEPSGILSHRLFLSIPQSDGELGTLFPLTPALSLGERENPSRRFDKPSLGDSATRWLPSSLSLRERARVRGNATPDDQNLRHGLRAISLHAKFGEKGPTHESLAPHRSSTN